MQSLNFHKAVFSAAAVVSLISCSSSGSLTKSPQENRQENTYLNGSFQPLKRTDYTLLSTTTGEASARQICILFFAVGKTKSNQELESNAYNQAVENCTGADAVILPRTKYKRLNIPLLLINYTSRKISVKGMGVKLSNNLNQQQ